MNKISEAMEQTKSSTEKNITFSTIIGTLKQRIASFFKPEEVEVTFKEDSGGNVISYTYTKVQQKQVA